MFESIIRNNVKTRYSKIIAIIFPSIVFLSLILLYNYVSEWILFQIQPLLALIIFSHFLRSYSINLLTIDNYPENAAIPFEYSKKILYLALIPLFASSALYYYIFTPTHQPPITFESLLTPSGISTNNCLPIFYCNFGYHSSWDF
jgi:hypothetical protein